MGGELKALVLVLAVLRLMPFVLTHVIFCSARFDSGRERCRKVLVPELILNAAGNGLFSIPVTWLFFGTKDVSAQIGSMLRMSCSYQEIGKFGMTVLVCAAAGILGGYALRILLLREDRLRLTRGRVAAVCMLALLCVPPAIIAQSVAFDSREYLEISEVARKIQVITVDPLNREKLGEAKEEISYAEIRNRGELDCEMRTLWLSETEDELKGYAFETIRIPAKGAVKLAMNEDRGLDLKKGGGSRVYLSDYHGQILDSVKVPALADEAVYSRARSADGEWTVVQLGKEAENAEKASVEPPLFSRESGFYEEAFMLTLEAPAGTVIRYTLDCSVPTAESPVYDGPIQVVDRSAEPNQYRSIQNVQNDYLNLSEVGTKTVEKAFIVRAAAEDALGNLSETVTKTYWISQDKFRKRNVISLVADPADLFDPEKGIYVTGAEYDQWYEENREAVMALSRSAASKNTDASGKQLPSIWDSEPTANFQQTGYFWERSADFTLLKNGNVYLSQPVGIRIQGHGTRRQAMKRFSIYAREEYSGNRYFDLPLYGDTLSHALVLRAGTLNALAQTLGSGRDVLTQPYIRVDVFLNGEYWYNTFLYEKATERLISTTFDVSEERVAIVKNGVVTEEGERGDNSFNEIYKYLSKHPSLSAQKNYERFGKILDIQSYIDATVIQTYLANMDYREKWNNYYWHTTEKENDAYGDSRWRVGLYDMDLQWSQVSYSAQVDHPWEIDPFTMYGVWQKSVKAIPKWQIFSALRKNDAFCQQFVLTYMDMVNTAFRPEAVLPVLEELGNKDSEVTDFFTYRPEYAVSFMAAEFELTGTQETVTLKTDDPAAGSITLNTIKPDLTDGEWSGKYFTDYPVNVSAKAKTGYTFSYWEVNGEKFSEKKKAEIPVSAGGVTIRAVYEAKEKEENHHD